MKNAKKVIAVMLFISISFWIYWSFFHYWNYIYGTGQDESYRKVVPTFYHTDSYSPAELRVIRKISDARNNMGIDLRGADVSALDLSEFNNMEELVFDDSTIWPTNLPKDFNPQLLLDIGKNPGLGIQELHQEGITGKGTSVAIIDQGLNCAHIEYKDKIMGYEAYHALDKSGTFHGNAVTSILAGENCGVAPETNVYYISSGFGYVTPFGYIQNLGILADCIDRIVEINGILPTDRKIRVISVSLGYKHCIGEHAVEKAIERADKAGIFVITTTPEDYYNFSILGLGRDFYDNPDDYESYYPGAFWSDDYYNGWADFNPDRTILVPMDARTYAGNSSNTCFEFSARGGSSWAVPWLAGLYTLCIQENPDLTPSLFIDTILKTGTTKTIYNDGTEYQLGTIVNPKALIAELSKR